MTRWKSAMPLEFGPRHGPASYAGGAQDMPDGVFPPEIMARSIVADVRRSKLARWMVQREPGCVVTIAGTEVPADEIAARKRLFAGARAGDQAAITELWETRRAWIIPGAREGGGTGSEPRKNMAHGRGVAHEGAAAQPTQEARA